MFTKYLKSSFLVAALSSGAMLVGCATQAKVDSFAATQTKAGIVYGQVNRVFSNEDLLNVCKKNIGNPDMLSAACSDAPNVHLVQVGILIDGASHTRGEVIPKSFGVEPGMIVKLDMSKPMGLHFVEIAARQETKSCKWAGHYNNMLDRGNLTNFGEIVSGFSLGVLTFVAAPAILVKARNTPGGVECNGWSYKEVFKEFLAAN
jgi:hypothetical protein